MKTRAKHINHVKITQRLTKTAAAALLLISVLSIFVFTPVTTNKAYADCTPSCSGDGCVVANHAVTRALIQSLHAALRLFITDEFQYQQRWIVTDFFYGYILPAMMMMTEQLSATGMYQMMIVGSFLDAKQQLETQQAFFELQAEAHRDYHSSLTLCYIGTFSRSMSATERMGAYYANVLSADSRQRQLGKRDNNASEGRAEDREGRIEQYITQFCDPDDNRGNLGALCTLGVPADRVNLDISYTRTIDYPRVLDLYFHNPGIPTLPDEEAVRALARYLYSNDVFDRPYKSVWQTIEGRDKLMDLRAVIAKRNVAENSFNAIVGMKSGGLDNNAMDTFVQALLVDMGVPQAEARTITGDDPTDAHPSYYLKLEWMAKKIYLRPEFYTNLYGKPANIKRKNVAMQAVDLIVDRDTFRSDIRTEGLLALWLEMEMAKKQSDVQNRLNFLDPSKKE